MQLPLVLVNISPVGKGIWGGGGESRTGESEKVWSSGQRQRWRENEKEGREGDSWEKV